MDYNPWGHKESDMTEPLSLSIYLNLRKWQPTPVFLPGEAPWAEEPGGLQSMGSQRVGHDCATSLYSLSSYS